MAWGFVEEQEMVVAAVFVSCFVEGQEEGKTHKTSEMRTKNIKISVKCMRYKIYMPILYVLFASDH